MEKQTQALRKTNSQTLLYLNIKKDMDFSIASVTLSHQFSISLLDYGSMIFKSGTVARYCQSEQ